MDSRKFSFSGNNNQSTWFGGLSTSYAPSHIDRSFDSDTYQKKRRRPRKKIYSSTTKYMTSFGGYGSHHNSQVVIHENYSPAHNMSHHSSKNLTIVKSGFNNRS